MKKERKVNMILAIVLWLICIAMFLPMVFVIINSFKTFGQVVMEPLALPAVFFYKKARTGSVSGLGLF